MCERYSVGLQIWDALLAVVAKEILVSLLANRWAMLVDNEAVQNKHWLVADSFINHRYAALSPQGRFLLLL